MIAKNAFIRNKVVLPDPAQSLISMVLWSWYLRSCPRSMLFWYISI